MTDTNMTDTNNHHGNGGGVPQDGGKRMRVLTTRRNDENRTSLLLVVVVWFRGLLCSVWHNTSCCVGCVGGDSRRVTPGCPFRTRLLSLWALMVLHLGGCGRVGYCQH